MLSFIITNYICLYFCLWIWITVCDHLLSAWNSHFDILWPLCLVSTHSLSFFKCGSTFCLHFLKNFAGYRILDWHWIFFFFWAFWMCYFLLFLMKNPLLILLKISCFSLNNTSDLGAQVDRWRFGTPLISVFQGEPVNGSWAEEGSPQLPSHTCCYLILTSDIWLGVGGEKRWPPASPSKLL